MENQVARTLGGAIHLLRRDAEVLIQSRSLLSFVDQQLDRQDIPTITVEVSGEREAWWILIPENFMSRLEGICPHMSNTWSIGGDVVCRN